jgi:hypothetical protein
MSNPIDNPSNQQIVNITPTSGSSDASDLITHYREQHGINIKIRSSSPAVDQLLAESRMEHLSLEEQAAYEKNYDKGDPSYDKIYQTHDKS